MTEINAVAVVSTKPWYKSKTLWFNVLVAALAALEASASMIKPFLKGNVYGYGLLILTAGNAMLRIITTQGLSLK